MKPIKFLGVFLLTFGMLIGLSGCMEKELTEIWNTLKDRNDRITKLEELATTLNDEVAGLQTLLTAPENADYITGVTDNNDGSYTVTFHSAASITIKNGEDGEKPVIGAKEGNDGILYWEFDGDYLLDEKSGKIPVTAVTPKIKINESEMWMISTDGGNVWVPTFVKATSGASVFSKNPELSDDGKSYTFHLTGGSSFKVPAYQETSLVFSVGGEPQSNLSDAIKLSETDPVLGYTIQSSAGAIVKAVVTDNSSCKATVNSTSSTTGNISLTGLTGVVSLNVYVQKDGKKLATYILKVTSSDNPALLSPSVTNVAAVPKTDKVTVTATFNSAVASLECHLYIDGEDKAPFNKSLTETEINNGLCSFDLGSGLAAGTYSLQIIPVSSKGSKGNSKTSTVVISGSTPSTPNTGDPSIAPVLTSYNIYQNAPLTATISVTWDASVYEVGSLLLWWWTDADENDEKWLPVTGNPGSATGTITVPKAGNYYIGVTPYTSTAVEGTHTKDEYTSIWDGSGGSTTPAGAPVLSSCKISQNESLTANVSVTWDASSYEVGSLLLWWWTDAGDYKKEWVSVTGNPGSASGTIAFPTAGDYYIGATPYTSSAIEGKASADQSVSIWAGTGGGTSTGAGKRKFPMACMNITQGRGAGYSHKNLNAYDLAGMDSGIDKFTATGTYVVTAVFHYNYATSSGYANTILFYDVDNDVTLALVHMNSIDTSNWYVGRIFYPGEVMYYEGTTGKATGNHIHMEIGRGRQNTKPNITVNGTSNYQLKNLINIEDYFYIDDSVTVKNDAGYKFERR